MKDKEIKQQLVHILKAEGKDAMFKAISDGRFPHAGTAYQVYLRIIYGKQYAKYL